MTIEQSHDKARTTLPRSSDATTLPTDPERPAWRQPDGRVGPRNELARFRAFKEQARKDLRASPGADAVADDMWRTYLGLLRWLRAHGLSDGPLVIRDAVLFARHTALEAFWSSRSAELGRETAEGQGAEDRASKHGQRVERLSVTIHDLSNTATRKPKKGELPFWLEADPTPANAPAGEEAKP
ncbi:MAG TPA: hypothetical protein VK550_16630 [Polyangiaceae bacterium]|nr:hypothetical protein [Polyangiaceae bacterium]